MEHATISSVCLIRFSPIILEVRWEMNTREGHLPQHCHFKVWANDNEIVSNCRETHAQLYLEPGTRYSLKVQTLYTHGAGTHFHSNVYHYTTPTAMDSKCIELNSVVMYVVIPMSQ